MCLALCVQQYVGGWMRNITRRSLLSGSVPVQTSKAMTWNWNVTSSYFRFLIAALRCFGGV